MGFTIVCTLYTITFLKLWSYVQVNHWCRLERDKSISKKQRGRSFSENKLSKSYHRTCKVICNLTKKNITDKGMTFNRKVSIASGIVQYPNNLTIVDMYYFMLIPSLCYELNFPRTSRIRKRLLCYLIRFSKCSFF